MSGPSVKRAFEQASSIPEKRTKRKNPPPFSLRLSLNERALLKKEARRLPLGEYIRRRLFGDAVLLKGKKRAPRKPHVPSVDHVALAQLLGTFGQSELGRSMLALSIAAQCGALPVDEELTEKLNTACDDINEMRRVLIVALGLKPQSGDSL